jgi:hypothetical protein
MTRIDLPASRSHRGITSLPADNEDQEVITIDNEFTGLPVTPTCSASVPADADQRRQTTQSSEQ